MNLIDAVVTAWKAGYTIFYPVLARVMLVKSYVPQVQGSDTPRGNLTGNIGSETNPSMLENIEWLSPGKPALNSRFVLLRTDNLEGQRLALGFTKYDEIKTVVGQMTEVEINDQRALVRYGGMAISMEFTTDTVSLTNGTSVSMVGTKSAWTITGPVTFNDTVTFVNNVTASKNVMVTGNVIVDGDVTVDAKGTGVSSQYHGHSTSMGPTTGKIPNGEAG